MMAAMAAAMELCHRPKFNDDGGGSSCGAVSSAKMLMMMAVAAVMELCHRPKFNDNGDGSSYGAVSSAKV